MAKLRFHEPARQEHVRSAETRRRPHTLAKPQAARESGGKPPPPGTQGRPEKPKLCFNFGAKKLLGTSTHTHLECADHPFMLNHLVIYSGGRSSTGTKIGFWLKREHNSKPIKLKCRR